MRIVAILTLAVAATAFAIPTYAGALTAGLTGTVKFSTPTPAPGQTLTITGSFTSYTATAGLPQINGDLPSYGFTLNETVSGFDAATTTATYTGTGTIFYAGPGATPAGNEVVTNLTSVPLSVAFTTTNGITTGVVTGQLIAGTPFQPINFPGVVDFAQVNPGTVLATFSSVSGSTSGTFTGTLTATPEPATLAVLTTGLLGLARLRRRA